MKSRTFLSYLALPFLLPHFAVAQSGQSSRATRSANTSGSVTSSPSTSPSSVQHSSQQTSLAPSSATSSATRHLSATSVSPTNTFPSLVTTFPSLFTTSPSLITTFSIPSPSSVPVSTTSIPAPSPTPSSIPEIDTLPLRPQITPTFAIVGVIFLLSGSAYVAVGIRAKWLYIFFSSAYLVALAITVLIVYVLVPPISNGVQAAYFVAALAGGCVVGGVSLIFRDITEGLACLLGGFCLAMWFLVLKSGGLVTSTGARAGLIGAFCVSAFAFNFSHFTRDYARMASIAFAGATVLVLGIDCFTRAGLKEFWVYIWALNDRIFPLGTHTYPLTRGIKVEIAAIVVLFLCGLLSQMKLFKILEDRRTKKAAAQARDAEDREHLDGDVGRRVEDQNSRERALWEQKYAEFGYKDHASAAASAAGSTYAPSTYSREQSVKDLTVEAREISSHSVVPIEMTDLSRQLLSCNDSKDKRISVHVRSVRDEVTQNPTLNQPPSGVWSLQRIAEDSSRPSTAMSSRGAELKAQRRISLLPSAPPPPVVLPMPFSVSEQELQEHDDVESGASRAESFAWPAISRKRKSLQRTNLSAVDDYDSEDSELDVPHLEDDRESSLAATFDGLTDDEDGRSLRSLSRPSSPTRRAVKTMSLRQPSLRRVGSVSDLKNVEPMPKSAASGLKRERRQSDPAPTALVEVVLDGPRNRAPENLGEVLDLTTARKLGASTTSSEAHSSTLASFSELKNAQTYSKVAKKYKTFEWSKGLDGADAPALDMLTPTDEGIQVERVTSTREVPAPVDAVALSRNGSGIESRNISSTNPYRRTSRPSPAAARLTQQSYSDFAPPMNRSPSNPTSVYGAAPAPITAQRSSSQPMLMTQSQRNATTAFAGQPLAQSPVVSLNGSPFSSSQSLVRSDSDNIALSSRKTMLNQDDMPLSRRRTILQQQGGITQSKRYSGGSRQSTYPPLPQPQTQNQNIIYDSHQPQRGQSLNAQAQQARVASFHHSLRQDPLMEGRAARAAIKDEAHRSMMMNQKREAQAAVQQQQYERATLDSAVETRMRRGDMLDLHRDMLRRMQSSAK